MSVFAGRRRFVLVALFIFAFVCPTVLYWYEIQSTITIAARPLWAPPAEGPRRIIPHYFADNVDGIRGELCKMHGWSPRPHAEWVEVEMWEAIILDAPTDAEIDLLELRLNELSDVVNKVFIVESNRTINGTPKGFYFGEKQWDDRLSNYRGKIVYRAVPAPPIDSIRSPSPAAWSARLRSEMNSLLRARSLNTRRAPLVLFSSVDEIPASHTIHLLRDCSFPSPLHLQLRRFSYTFEWSVRWDSWRAQVHVWDTGTRLEALGPGEARIARRRTEYSREMVSEVALADSGWHCEYCYKDLHSIIAKMQDEYGAEAASITPEVLQQAICEGRELFSKFPEAYTYKDMLQLLNPQSYAPSQSSSSPSKQDIFIHAQLARSSISGISLPGYTIEAVSRYRHILPGGCQRLPESTPSVREEEGGAEGGAPPVVPQSR